MKLSSASKGIKFNIIGMKLSEKVYFNIIFYFNISEKLTFFNQNFLKTIFNQNFKKRFLKSNFKKAILKSNF